MCGNQYNPLHKVISINDLIDGNIITNAYVLFLTDLVASPRMTEWRSVTLKLQLTVESKLWLQNTEVGHSPLNFCNSLRQLLIIDLIFTESKYFRLKGTSGHHLVQPPAQHANQSTFIILR